MRIKVPQRPGLKTETAAAEWLGLSTKTVQRYRISGGGPRYLKVGARVLYDEHDLEAWLQRHGRESTSEAA